MGVRLSPHFNSDEFECHHCHKLAPSGPNMQLVNKLEKLRAAFYPKGLTIVDSYRCAVHNKAVGGATHSQHLTGEAADIPDVAKYWDVAKLGLFTGIGYNTENAKVTHVDVRPGDPKHPTFWTYTNGKTDSPNNHRG